MPDQPYCLKHNTRLMESNVNRFYFDSLLITWVVTYNISWLNEPDSCYCCRIIEEQLQDFIKEAAKLEANVEAGGGSYTTNKMSVFRGGQ